MGAKVIRSSKRSCWEEIWDQTLKQSCQHGGGKTLWSKAMSHGEIHHSQSAWDTARRAVPTILLAFNIPLALASCLCVDWGQDSESCVDHFGSISTRGWSWQCLPPPCAMEPRHWKEQGQGSVLSHEQKSVFLLVFDPSILPVLLHRLAVSI